MEVYDVEKFKIEFGKKVKVFRLLKGMSQEDLADKLGTVAQAISSLERGINFISLEKLIKLIEIFEIYPHELFYFQNSNVDTNSEAIQLSICELIKTFDPDELSCIYNLCKLLSNR